MRKVRLILEPVDKRMGSAVFGNRLTSKLNMSALSPSISKLLIVGTFDDSVVVESPYFCV